MINFLPIENEYLWQTALGNEPKVGNQEQEPQRPRHCALGGVPSQGGRDSRLGGVKWDATVEQNSV